jgi:hypothetical protein
MWSDSNLCPFIAVTAHWIETVWQETPTGKVAHLRMRSELIGFIKVPGRHTGPHLAAAFAYILTCVGIVKKVSQLLELLHHSHITYNISWAMLQWTTSASTRRSCERWRAGLGTITQMLNLTL